MLTLRLESEMRLAVGDEVVSACCGVGRGACQRSLQWKDFELNDAAYFNWQKRFRRMGHAPFLELKSLETENDEPWLRQRSERHWRMVKKNEPKARSPKTRHQSERRKPQSA
ncbi:MAG: hypothetical protein AAGH83_07070 [Pseudomonadota bacterium]